VAEMRWHALPWETSILVPGILLLMNEMVEISVKARRESRPSASDKIYYV